jgi:acyl-CoA reductase-like NAD-dependent aldehyde dehydrogenase
MPGDLERPFAEAPRSISPTEIRFREAARATRDAAQAWQRAGVAKRLEVIAQAGERLHQRRTALLAAFRSDGFSAELASFWSEWVLRAAEPALLADYARAMARFVPVDEGGEILVRRPDGVVLLSPPANAPTINAAPIFSILLAGNGVLLRAPEGGAGAKLLVEEAIRPALAEAGFAVEVATILVGKSREIVAALLPEAAVDTIVYFGKSTALGELPNDARRAGKKLLLELEGSDHMAVWRDGDIDAAVASTRSVWHLSTQACPIPKHLLVHAAVYDRFLEQFLATLPDAARTIEADPERGRLVPVRPGEWEQALAELQACGKVRAGGHRMNRDGVRDDAGPYVAPTVVELDAPVCLGHPLRVFTDEIAWPLIPVVRCGGDDQRAILEMCAIMAATSHGLRASVWTESPTVMARFTREIGQFGLLRFNDDHARPPAFASAWGGTRGSGGPSGELCFFWEKTSRLQAIDCRRLSRPQIEAVLEALGCANLGVDGAGGH